MNPQATIAKKACDKCRLRKIKVTETLAMPAVALTNVSGLW